MSAITIENDLVHYEVLGRGRPVILLHGWLGSWRYWVPAMQQLSMKYRTYALDFWGFGDSGRDTRRYSFESQVMLLDQFMEKMGITKSALVGHDLGASVGAHYAVQHPDRVPRLMTVAPPLFWMAPKATALTNNPPPAIPATTVQLGMPVNPEAETVPRRSDEKDDHVQVAAEQRATTSGQASMANGLPKSPRDAAMPPVDKPSKEITGPSAPSTLPEQLPEVPGVPSLERVDLAAGQVQRANPLKDHLETLDRLELLKRHVEAGADLDKLKVEVEKADTLAITMSVESFADVDTLRDLKALAMPAVMVYGAADTFLPSPDARMLTGLAEGRTFHAIKMENTRHFPMLENMAGFTRLLLDFLEAPDVTRLTIKETWERRVR